MWRHLARCCSSSYTKRARAQQVPPRRRLAAQLLVASVVWLGLPSKVVGQSDVASKTAPKQTQRVDAGARQKPPNDGPAVAAQRPREAAPQSHGDPREAYVEVKVSPQFRHRFAVMNLGVRQHLDRKYTYDEVPPFMEGGLLFQGIHRPPKGTKVTIELERPAQVYFFFHNTVDGGYGEIFAELSGWSQVKPAPKYDLEGGDHGKHMIAYRADLGAGTHTIPATTKARACFSIVFQFSDQPSDTPRQTRWPLLVTAVGVFAAVAAGAGLLTARRRARQDTRAEPTDRSQ